MKGDYSEPICENQNDGRLVFEPRDELTESERERADLHLGNCSACEFDMDIEYLLRRFNLD